MTKRIGKSLNERYGVRGLLTPDDATAVLNEVLPSQAAHIVRVRAQDTRMIVCLVVRADAISVRMCKGYGFDMTPGGTGVFGLLGPDAARAFPELPAHQRAWLEEPCAPRETKIVLIERGLGVLSLHAEGGAVTVTAR
jgi:hypothetical protein